MQGESASIKACINSCIIVLLLVLQRTSHKVRHANELERLLTPDA